ncbi:MAG: hypothetical protein NTY91_01660 [Euryarchaeota archaeon]|nr:hypothetical protein [Euryarchaeota archaeon]
MKHDQDTGILLAQTSFFFPDEQAIPMTAITYALLGFAAGLFTMTIITLYRYVIKKASQ